MSCDVIKTRGLHGPVFFGPARPGPFNSGPARPGPARPGPLPFQEDQAQHGPARFQLGPARPVAVVAKKRTVLKTTKKHRIKHFFTVFCIYYLFLYYLLSTRILGVSNYFMSARPGPARPVCIRARPGPFKLIYFPARPGPGPARPAGRPARADL